MANNQYLTFRLHDLQYGIEAALVQEIFPLPELTPIAEAPPDLLGIVNLREQVVPVMHLDLLTEYALKRCHINDFVVVVQWESLQIGILVHQVNEVIDLNDEVIEKAFYENKSDINTTIIDGVATVDEGMIMLLNCKKIIREPDAVLTLIWDTEFHQDVMATSSIIDIKQSLPDEQQQYSLETEDFDDVLQQIEQQLENEGKKLPISKTLPNFYDLYCPNATPEERAIFRERADNLRQSIKSSEVVNRLMSLAVIRFDNQYFGLDLELVREFTDIQNLTPIPCCPNHIIGNMNLRGEIVTLVDIRNALNLSITPVNVGSKAVVIEVDNIVAGLPADQVLEVVYLNPAEMTLLPAIESEQREEYLLGTAPFREKTLSVLDLPKILTKGELVVNEEA